MLKKSLALLLALLLILPFSLIGCQEKGSEPQTETKDPLAEAEPSLAFTLLDDGTWSVAKGDFGYKNEIVIPAEHEGRAVTEIAEGGFAGAIAKTIVLPDSIRAIGAAAFRNCSNLTYLTLPEQVTEIPMEAFKGCIAMQTFTIPAAVTAIGDFAFEECTALTAITIPEGVTSIGNQAFYNCELLASITLPSTLQTVGLKAFAIIGDKTLQKNHVLQYNMFDGDRYLGNTANPRLVLIQCTSTADTYTLHENTRIIYDSAFSELPLTAITLHENVTDIGASAFARCTSLTAIHIPAKIKTIGDSAFYYCRALKTITGLAGVETIGDSAFAYCNKLTGITLGNGVTVVGENVFNGTSSLQTNNHQGISYIGSAENPYLLLYRVNNKNEFAYTIHPDAKIIYPSAFSNCQYVEEIELPTGLTRIGRSAFSNCSNLLAITIPDTVTVIADRAFYGCKRFYSLVIPLSVTYIGQGALQGCSGITALNIPFVGQTASGAGSRYFGHLFGAQNSSDHLTKIPDGLKTVTVSGGTSIGASAFSHCKNLETIKLPASLKVIETNAFFLDKAIRQVHISDLSAWCSVQIASADANPLTYGANLIVDGKKVTDLVIPETVTEIGPYTFNGCKNLTTVTVSDTVTVIGEGAFQNCAGLTTVTMGDGITTLRNAAFYGCEALTAITLSDSLSEIGSSVFRGCKTLESITLPASLTFIGDRAFKSCESLVRVRFRNPFGWHVSQTVDGKGAVALPLFGSRNAARLVEEDVNSYWHKN